MGLEADQQDVRFDFEGSLEFARTLWRLSDDLHVVGTWRRGAIERALRSWQGAHAVEFADRANDEIGTTAAVVEQLRNEAGAWALLWTQARELQNHRLRARAVDEERDSRSFGEWGVDKLTGSDDSNAEVAATPCLMTPQPPNFEDTNVEFRP